MPLDDIPQKLESVWIQRNPLNQFYEQINISGSDLIVYHSSSGELQADKISVWAAKYNIGTGGGGTSLNTGSTYPITTSWANNTVSSSYSLTSSYSSITIVQQLNTTQSMWATQSLSAISASWASSSLSASYWDSSSVNSWVENNYQFKIATGSTLPITSSQSITASYALNAGTSFGLATGSTYPITASQSVTASYWNSSSVNSWVGNNFQFKIATGSTLPITSSQSITASYALNGGSGGGLATGSTYPITASRAVTANGADSVYLTNANADGTERTLLIAPFDDGIFPGYNAVDSSGIKIVALSKTIFATASIAVTASYWNSSSVNSWVGNNYQSKIATGSTLPITASQSISSSYWDSGSIVNFFGTKQNNLATGSTLPITSSQAITASYALNAGSGGGLATGSTYPITASFSVSASIANSASILVSPNSLTSVNALNTGISASVDGTLIATLSENSVFDQANGSGSLFVNGKLSGSNINAGYPISFTWGSGLEGSYFTNWNESTVVSEMLRFFAGAFSASYPNPSSNTRTYSSLTTTANNIGSIVTINGRIPKDTTNATLLYLVTQSWANTGSLVLAAPVFRNGTTYNTTYDSVIGGTTTVSSSIGAQSFGLGPLAGGVLQPFYVSASVVEKFYSNTGSAFTYTYTSNSLYSQSVNNTSGTGISLAKIPTANVSVIPSAYQDGKFNSITGSGLRWNGAANDLTDVSSSGKYEITTSIGIASGSSPYVYLSATNASYYFTPLTDGTFATNTVALVGASSNSIQAYSRSLSGAPYLTTGSLWKYTFTGSGVFNPLYFNGTFSQIVSGSHAASAATLNARTASVDANGAINSTGTIVDSTTLVAKPIGAIPSQTDYIKYAITLIASGSTSNITQSGVSHTGIPISSSLLTRSGTTSYFGTLNIPYHTAGDFNVPVTSGSLAYWGRAQNFSSSTDTGITESFLDETQRIQLSNACLGFTGSYFTSSNMLAVNELQVKPGFLVNPSGSYRYWYPAGFGGNVNTYYVRHFRRSSVVGTLSIDPGVTIINWDDTTSPGISIALLFESARYGVFGNCRLYDLNKLVGSIQTNVVPDGFQNPFSSNVDIYYNGTGAKVGTLIQFPIVNANGVFLDGTANQDEFYVIVRYKGDPVPLMQINVT